MNADVGRRDRARAFVPELIPALEDLDRTGPLDAREQRDLARVHEARDHYGTARWMRGMALEAAFRRQLFRGEDGTRTRQEYLDAEWDGMSESAAYLEIGEWRLARQIAETYGRPVAASHVRALGAAAELHGAEVVAAAYVQLRQYGTATARRVTESVVKALDVHLVSVRSLEPGRPAEAAERLDDAEVPESGEAPGPLPELESLFAPGQPPEKVPKPRRKGQMKAGEPVEPTTVIPKSWNGWRLSEEQSDRLSEWVAGEAERCGMEPAEIAELLLDAITGETAPLRPWADHVPQT
ncbi:hypothetical protein [Streptomyces sp. cmx-10-25]|uniref:hypothetical protein n=1 Tax=Streptomyces sp. cmx-10-25 TaxID=2790919 RepID=UPI00397FBF14